MRNKKILILTAVLVVVLGASAFAYNQLAPRFSNPEDRLSATSSTSDAATEAPSPQVDDSEGEPEPELTPAPDFTVYDADGNAVRLSDFQGQPVVLNFWASWCPPCKSEMPDFDDVYRELDNDFVFMMVDLVDGSQETVDSGAAYVSEQGFTFPVYYDVDQEAAYQYQVTSIPSTYFVDAQGNIAAGVKGMIDRDTLLLGMQYALDAVA